MKAFLPIAFILLAAFALLGAMSFIWVALRGLFGGDAQRDMVQSQAMRRRADLLDEKDAILRSVKDLEFERQVGKISDEDWKRLDAEFRIRAKQIIKQLEEDLKEHRVKAKALVASELGSEQLVPAKLPEKSA